MRSGAWVEGMFLRRARGEGAGERARPRRALPLSLALLCLAWVLVGMAAGVACSRDTKHLHLRPRQQPRDAVSARREGQVRHAEPSLSQAARHLYEDDYEDDDGDEYGGDGPDEYDIYDNELGDVEDYEEYQNGDFFGGNAEGKSERE